MLRSAGLYSFVISVTAVTLGTSGLVRAADATRNLLQTPVESTAGVQEVVWHVTVGSRAPDCFQRDVILVNGSFQPTLIVTQGRHLKVSPA